MLVWNNSFSALLYTGTASNLGDNIISVLAQDENGCYSNDTVILKVVDCASIEEHLSNTTFILTLQQENLSFNIIH